jgi:hypothetical protein
MAARQLSKSQRELARVSVVGQDAHRQNVPSNQSINASRLKQFHADHRECRHYKRPRGHRGFRYAGNQDAYVILIGNVGVISSR